ncbi:MAG: hypothetical protein IR159_08680, partial [Brevundimonas sp.]|nr:hypothetical protein [Brevundimonas sp.]
MRPSFRFALLAALARRPAREVERADRIVTAVAPENWSDAQIEAWLDWCDAQGVDPDSPDPMAEAAARFAGRLGLKAAAAEELAACLVLGIATPAAAPRVEPDLLDLANPAVGKRLAA